MSSLSKLDHIKIDDVKDFLEDEFGPQGKSPKDWSVREDYLASVTRGFKGKSDMPNYDFMEMVKEMQYCDHNRCTKGDAQAIYAKIVK